MAREISAHEMELDDNGVLTCKHCNTKVAEGFEQNAESIMCTFDRERKRKVNEGIAGL